MAGHTDSPDFSLTGKVALITGAGRGIGLGMAKALAAQGAAVAIQDIDQDVAAAEAAKMQGAVALGGDLADRTVVEGLVPQVRQRLGGLHILINNAAVQKHAPWTEITPDDAEWQWRVNLLAPLMLCQTVAPIFKAQQFGRIINLGSIQGKGGFAGMIAYSMSKAAIENMTKALARALAADGITVNCVAPGYFNTWRNRGDFKTPQDLAERGKHVPTGRIGEPQDAGGLAVLLCSKAGEYITGQTIYVDGGMSAR